MSEDDILKLKAIVLYILQLAGGRFDKYKILKTIYFAEKNHLRRFGCRLSNDNYMAMPHGPVSSFVDDALKNNTSRKGVSIIINAININRNEIIAKENPDMDEISSSNIDCLKKAYDDIKDLSFFNIRDLSHDLAYCKASTNGKMNIFDVMEDAGANEDSLRLLKDQMILEGKL